MAGVTRGYEFGPFRLDLLTHRLLRDGRPVPLTPKALDTLKLLIEHRDRVLGKDELMRALWPDTFVEEANLAQHVFMLRRVLGAQPDGQPHIETIPKRGYRFGAEAAAIVDQPRDTPLAEGERSTGVAPGGAEPAAPLRQYRTRASGRWYGSAAVVILVAIAAGLLYSRSAQRQRLEDLIVVLEAAADNGDLDAAYAALEGAAIDAADPRLASVAQAISGTISVDTRPAADVRAQRVRLGRQAPTVEAIDLGSTPITDRRLVAGEYVIDLAASGAARTRLLVELAAGSAVRIDRDLARGIEGRGDMVFVDEGEAQVGGRSARVGAFFIDSHEVTNDEFAEFVADGGYDNPAHWPATILIDGQPTPRAQALIRFVDRTGLPGPRGWSNGRYPDGQADHPVVGVSWYEASAYARWAGKTLPAFDQWQRAATGASASGFPWGSDARTAELRANFGLAGTTPVGAYPGGLSPFGLADMAGNAREWLRDEAPGGLRPAAGSSWLEPAHDFERVEWFDAAQSSPGIGFRLVTPAADGAEPAAASTLLAGPGAPPERARDDVWIRRPVDDDTFESFFDFFSYDPRVPFDVQVTETATGDAIITERLTFQSSPGVRIPAFLLHRADTAGRPGVVLLHSAGARGKDLPNNVALATLMARAGWSVIAIDLPYFGERATDLLTTYTDDEKHQRLYNQPGVYLAWTTQTVRDVRRAFDLLLARTGADAGRIALVGSSRGAMAAALAAGIDSRFSPVALLFGGHATAAELHHLELVCPANYIGRIAPRPLLMLNSVNDQTFPRSAAVDPLFALAGQPKDATWTTGGHMVMTEADMAAVMTWLQRAMR